MCILLQFGGEADHERAGVFLQLCATVKDGLLERLLPLPSEPGDRRSSHPAPGVPERRGAQRQDLEVCAPTLNAAMSQTLGFLLWKIFF